MKLLSIAVYCKGVMKMKERLQVEARRYRRETTANKFGTTSKKTNKEKNAQRKPVKV